MKKIRLSGGVPLIKHDKDESKMTSSTKLDKLVGLMKISYMLMVGIICMIFLALSINYYLYK
jgi:hypothetical protein